VGSRPHPATLAAHAHYFTGALSCDASQYLALVPAGLMHGADRYMCLNPDWNPYSDCGRGIPDGGLWPFAGADAMHQKEPVPLLLVNAPAPRLRPVCGAVSYSRDGIHPQCAEQQADASRMERVRAAAKTVKRKGKAVNRLLALSPLHKLSTTPSRNTLPQNDVRLRLPLQRNAVASRSPLPIGHERPPAD
jgi:hypothetical protein